MNSKIRQKHVSLLALLIAANLALSLLPGCASRRSAQTQTVSAGQQLQDLDKAYKEGSISSKEYDKMRKAIIKQND